MKLDLFIAAVATALLAVPSSTQVAPPGMDPRMTDRQGTSMANWTPEPGQPLLLRLNENLDTKKTKKGDRVTARVVMALEGNGAEYKKSELIGHVTEASAFSGQSRARIGILFDQIKLANGTVHEFHGRLQAIGGEAGPVNRQLCNVNADAGPNSTCLAIPGDMQLTKETAGIFNLDGSLNVHDFLYNQVIASARRNFKLHAGTRMVIVAATGDTEPTQ